VSRTLRFGLATATVVAFGGAWVVVESAGAHRGIALGLAGLVAALVAGLTWWAVPDRVPQAETTRSFAGTCGTHAFISYSRRDTGYVQRLVTFLRGSGIDVWVDEEVPNGTRWDSVLKDKIDTSAAVVLVMSPSAEESDWVSAEVDRARAQGKPVLPLLLSGEVAFGLGRIQYEDVANGRMPRPSFVRRLRLLTDPSWNGEDTSAPDRPARGLLPIPTAAHTDVGTYLAHLAADRRRRIDVLIGPDDSGKSALLRHLVLDYRDRGGKVRYIDLSLVPWREALLGEPAGDVAFIDHIDRIAESEGFKAAFDIFDRVLPTLFSAGMSRLVVALSVDWRARFVESYRLGPEVILKKAMPGVWFEVHTIRPYVDSELLPLCGDLGLNADDFGDDSLRRAGVLAMASSMSDDYPRLSGAGLRDVLATRWIEAGNDTIDRDARRAMWSLLGTLTLRGKPFTLDLPHLHSLVDGRFNAARLRAQIGGPLRWEAEHVLSDSPAWADLAAAKALQAVIRGQVSEPITVPLRSSVLDALRGLSDQQELAVQVDRRLSSMAGADFAATGYLGPILGTLCAQLSRDAEIVLRDLLLQGPDHEQLPAVDPDIAAAVEEALLTAMSRSMAGLLASLSDVPPAEPSAYRGGYRVWQTARAWAAALPLRASAENAAMRLLPSDGSWRYEDILDVSVTGATTTLMDIESAALARLLDRRQDPAAQYLADIWDGINDGAWDQIDANSHDYVTSLNLPSGMTGTVTAIGCRMQRARLGAQDVDGWRLINCELLLADFRSCSNVERVEFTGSNWWTAILPPPARYHHSRSCATPEFLHWCESPPWANPYYTSAWPTPFA
jgi:hypothetical protein